MKIIRKQIIGILLLGIISGCQVNEGSDDYTMSKNGWVMVWNDEFDGTEIDKNKWGHEIGGWGFGNNEWQYYTQRPANSYVQDSKLVIKAMEEEFGGMKYTSAKLVTKGKAAWTYGRFEIRAKLPEGQGIWPAIWMMPSDLSRYGGWPSCGEIDIMELVGHLPNKVHGTIHMGNPHYYTGGDYTLEEGKFSDDFHTFILEWTPTEMRWYVDDTLYSTKNNWYTRKNKDSDFEPYPAPFNRDFYLILNLAVGGNWPGYPDEKTVFPQTLEIDYVRVYQPTDGNYGE